MQDQRYATSAAARRSRLRYPSFRARACFAASSVVPCFCSPVVAGRACSTLKARPPHAMNATDPDNVDKTRASRSSGINRKANGRGEAAAGNFRCGRSSRCARLTGRRARKRDPRFLSRSASGACLRRSHWQAASRTCSTRRDKWGGAMRRFSSILWPSCWRSWSRPASSRSPSPGGSAPPTRAPSTCRNLSIRARSR